MAVKPEPVALEPATRRDRRRVRPPVPQPGRKIARHRRRRHLTALVSALVLAVAAVAAAGRLTGAGPAGMLHPEERETPVSFAQGPGSSAAPPSIKPLAAGWRLVRRAPIAARHGAISTWTGEDVLVWGGVAGGQPQDDGAAYHPDTDHWRLLPASPLGAREGAAATWTGREWILWGGTDAGNLRGDGAAYNPDTGTWRVLPPAPFRSSGAQAVWTGSEMLVWGASEHTGNPAGAAYDPERDRWRRLPSGGSDGYGPVVWTGTELVVWDPMQPAAFDPATNRWRRLPLPPATPWWTRMVAWTGTELLVVGGMAPPETGPISGGAAYDPVANRWRTLAPAPDPLDVSDATATWTGRLLVLARGPSRVQTYDPARDAWHVMPGLSEGPRVGAMAVWTGDEMVFWGGYGILGTLPILEEGVAWRPDSL